MYWFNVECQQSFRFYYFSTFHQCFLFYSAISHFILFFHYFVVSFNHSLACDALSDSKIYFVVKIHMKISICLVSDGHLNSFFLSCSYRNMTTENNAKRISNAIGFFFSNVRLTVWSNWHFLLHRINFVLRA